MLTCPSLNTCLGSIPSPAVYYRRNEVMRHIKPFLDPETYAFVSAISRINIDALSVQQRGMIVGILKEQGLLPWEFRFDGGYEWQWNEGEGQWEAIEVNT